jgi:hypothetical protein
MIEKIIFNYLNSVLPVKAYLEEPEKPAKSYVLIEKTGSNRRNHVNRATIAVQSYAASMQKAAELNETVKTAMDNLINLPDIGASRLNSDYNFTDTATKRYRYQAVYDITHY